MNPATKHVAILAWLALGITLSATNLMLQPGGSAGTAPIRPEEGIQSAERAADPADRAAFIAAWTRWQTGEHAVSGVLVRSTGDEQREIRYREARLGDRWMHQVGPSVVLADEQERRVCHQDRTGQFLCTTMAGAASTGDQAVLTGAASTGAGLATVDFPTIGYTVSTLDHVTVMQTVVGAEPARPGSCWEARVNTDSETGEAITDRLWGARSWFCFDAETGALMLRQTITGESTETVVARMVSGEVTELDLAPSPTLAGGGGETRG